MSLANGVNTQTMRSLGPAGAVSFAAIKQENEQLRSMTDELGHRIKNLVAVMQSISRHTMHHTTTKDDFEVRFSGRIRALGRSIDCLIANDWHEARIDKLVRLELSTFAALDGAQFSAEGPPIGLQPNAARNIGLALHELATNASKYGSLSVPEGRVAVHWELVNRGERQRFRMSWRESGGPIVLEPKRWGFGRQVIQRLTAQALEAKVTHEFLPDGVSWKLDSPATFVVRARSTPATYIDGSSTDRRTRNVGQ
jgi:two-component sensor histidine kinase